MIRALALLSLAVTAGCMKDARSVPGSLPGDAIGALQVSEARLSSKTVAADGTPTESTGLLSSLRYSAGGYVTVTRFGAISGIEASAAIGWLTGDAASAGKSVYFNNEIGGVIQPLPRFAWVRLAGDFGVGYTLDDRYTYAGARLGIGPPSRKVMFDAAYRRQFGDTPGNDGAHEDRFRGWLTFRLPNGRAALHVGFDYVRGDQRSLSGGMEISRDDYLFRGRYEQLSLTIGLGVAAKHPKLSGL